MYLATLSKHPHVNSNQLIITVYKIHCLTQSRSMTYASLSRSTMSSLVDPMTRDNLYTNIISVTPLPPPRQREGARHGIGTP